LQQHERPEEGSPQAVARALARAESVAEQLRQSGPPVIGPAQRAALDPGEHERRHLAMSRELLRDYVADLTAALEEAAADRARLRQAAATAPGELAELRARAATLEAIERGRWWRFYRRLLPLLRLLRGAG
jgi:hypothetical protein